MAGLLGRLLGAGSPEADLDETAWRDAITLPVFEGLDAEERRRLRDLAAAILADKQFSGAGGADVDAYMRTAIATFAALPVLNLGAERYRGWREIIIYPGEFIHEGQETDAAGVVHHVRHVRSGEAMHGGPMVLSWDDVAASGGGQGYNVVIHEFAHKLDMGNGAVDGLPPLHAGVNPTDWSAAFTSAYDDFRRRAERGSEGDIDPYAAQSPAEFFAVLSEYFFEWPEALHAAYPAVYEQMRRFYRQDPLKRLENPDRDPANP
ncbi:MAG TPA: zinc-dependent peptidase [Thiobacillaceae bacterium]|nr:zinc-dependent peptidase [Thiobacillaceae bacterium]